MDEIYRSQFRMPYSLYEQLKASAEANHRSVNAELVARLEASLNTPGPLILFDECHRSEAPQTERALELLEQIKSELLAFYPPPKE